ncbi:hypothetical protein A3A52_04910 [Candidatus Woesebacteria bacterium RIFCSPLOWO2_01_FULL_39_14]|uniref:Glycosyl transferase family 1 domain-containing protein n=1 Tax=Candidatus Woesebacteria bacterium RIFCSPLOWO2_01_FULL_39_14 TaxID=1802518 RepID=A0A1F8BKD2_9BACT|nr:MAG: hypothetical protein A3A52_04910 [Candidatus Woesebacteria bacterium RIFCSPLOWO2_01_FULL_39_14]
MKAAIYNPYLDTLGGGERYTMAFAKALIAEGYKVDVEWKNTAIKNRLENRFGIKLNDINFIHNIKRGDGYDVCFWVSDGSIPLLRAHKNFLHFQFPFREVNGRSLLNKMKMFRIEKIICNSYFTKSFIDKEYGVESIVIYPPIDAESFKPKRKENIILYVGRFSQLEQTKNQHILISSFKKLYDSGDEGWKLILAGGVEVGVDNYIEKLIRSIKEYPIEIVKSPSFDELKYLYGISRIFWSAVGYGIDENKEPKKVEHFGISVVEAMAGGLVPVIYSAGGYLEIIADGYNGFLWKTKREFLKKTKELIYNHKSIRMLSTQAKLDAKVYEYERFEAEVGKLLY